MSRKSDLDRLPFNEYAQAMLEQDASTRGNSHAPKLTFEQIIATDMTFDEIEAEYGEETAINAGIARDPDNPELNKEDFAQMRPVRDKAYSTAAPS